MAVVMARKKLLGSRRKLAERASRNNDYLRVARPPATDVLGTRPNQSFTPAIVRQILVSVLNKRQAMPDETAMATLAEMLNDVTAAITLARFYPGDYRVRDAIEVLREFFERRRVQTLALSKTDFVRSERLLHRRWAELLQAERLSRTRFRNLVRAMERHDWSLDMDATAFLPKHERWYDVDRPIAAAFRLAMVRVVPRQLGLSSDGPVARFTAAVIPWITGEHTTAAAVAKHLQRGAGAKAGDPNR
jgi:hypothetical protein